jgi:ATP-dependent helicase/nuclease subunit A
VSLTPQQEAALALDQNIAITAGAGTGKTTTLKERYREILREHRDLLPTDIVTLTFTTDATNEMRDRIREVIDEELAAADTDAYGRWRQAKDELEDAYIHTIHGFCSRVLREFAVEAAVDPEFETLDAGDAETLIDDAITVVLDRYGIGDAVTADTGLQDTAAGNTTVEIADEWDIPGELTTLTRLYSRSGLESALASLFDERPDSVEWAQRWAFESPDAYVSYLSELVEASIPPSEADALMQQEATQTAIEDLSQLADRDLDVPRDDNGMAALTDLVAYLDETNAHTQEGTTFARQQFLFKVADHVTSGSGGLYSRSHYYVGTNGNWSDQGYEEEQTTLKAAFDSLADIIEPESRNLDHNPAVTRNAAEQAIALARLFQVTRVEYRRMKRRRTAFDYSDLITKATAFLADNEEVRRTLRDQFGYIMVDEVQDTDPRQWQLVKLLSGDDPDRFDGQNVFMVGDEKQSIYRFRNADVTQFQDARTTLLEDNPPGSDSDLALTTNFRTVESTLTVINELFEEVFQPAARTDEESDDESGGEADYEPYEAEPQWLEPCRQEGTEIDGSVEYLIVPDNEETDAALGLAESWYTDNRFVSRADREARALAARLTELFASDTEVYDPETETYVSVKPEHVAFLFRASTRMAAFERELDAHDIPYTNVAGSGFYETPEVLPLINLLKVFEDPHRDIPLYGVLRSPLFGFKDQTLAQARSAETSLWDSLATATPELQSARQLIRGWRRMMGLGDERTVSHWSALLSKIVDETGYLIGIGADDRSQQAVANVEKFREQLRTWEEGNARSVADLINRIEQARERDDDPSEATVPGDIEGVELRTIHSAKGLEFPVVVIPELTRKFNLRSSLSKAHFERVDGEPVLGMKAPTVTNPFADTKTAAYIRVRNHYKRRERAEQRRLLYVAATRTRDHLILSGSHNSDPETASGLEDAGDWDEATRWTDWVQPTLLDEPELVTQLARESAVQTTIGRGTYTIRRPTPPADWERASTDDEVPSDIEIPAPERTPDRVRMSATTFRDTLTEHADDWPSILRATASDAQSRSTVDDEAAVEQLGDDTVGTIVHKLCELDAPEEEWPHIIRRCVADPDSVSDESITAVTAHARAGLAGLRTLEEDHSIVSRHNEFTVSLDLTETRVVGDIDHLSVMTDGYLVVDYKTSDLERQSVSALAEHYFPQLLAYAGALVQNDSDAEQVVIALVFTDTGTVKQRVLTREDVEKLLDWTTGVLSEVN